MNRSFRRISIGILSGAVASTALIATLHYGVWSLILGVAVGVAYGAFLGIIHQALQDSAEHFFGPEAAAKVPAVSVTKRIVILGGGFAGMRTAECLEEKLRTDFSISLTLINETNALLFTPMLAEVAGSSLEPSHISTPLRSSLHRTEFIRGVVAGVDLERHSVILHGDTRADGAGRRE